MERHQSNSATLGRAGTGGHHLSVPYAESVADAHTAAGDA
jgi:hypothetical protein